MPGGGGGGGGGWVAPRQDPQQGGSLEARAGQTELSKEGRLNQGIEALLIEIIRYNLPPSYRQTFEKGSPLEIQIGQPDLPQLRDAQGRLIGESTRIRQVSYESPTQEGVFVRTKLLFSFNSGGFNVFGFTEYDDSTPGNLTRNLTRADLRISGLGVYTQQHLEEARTRLKNHGFLPPEPQAPVEPLAPEPLGEPDDFFPYGSEPVLDPPVQIIWTRLDDPAITGSEDYDKMPITFVEDYR